MKTLDDVKEFKTFPKLADGNKATHLMLVLAHEDKYGNLYITFRDNKQIFLQFDFDIDAIVENMIYNLEDNNYYIYDEYYDIAK